MKKIHIEEDGWVWLEDLNGVEKGLGDIDVDVEIVDKRPAQDDFHVYPLNDLKEHDTETKLKHPCKCNPTIDYEGNSFIIIHNAHDKREYNEIAQQVFKDSL